MKRLVMAVLTAATSLCVTAATLYVDYKNGTDAEESATFKTLAYAVGKANPNDEIVLAKGTHVLNANLTVSVPLTIRGEGEKEETLLVSDKTVRKWTVSGDGSFIYNLTLAGSKSPDDNYSEVYFSIAASTVSNVVVRSIGANPTPSTQSAEVGELWYVRYGTVLKNLWMTNCLPNKTLVYERNGATFENCVFSHNTTKAAGDLIWLGWSTPTFRHCTVSNNKIFSGNAVAVTSGYLAVLQNSLIWGNRDVDDSCDRNVSASIASTKNFTSVCTRPVDGWLGSGHVSQDPCLQADGYTVSLASSCRGAADPTCTTEFDILGTPRGAKPTIGAYEFVDDCPFTVTVTQTGTFGRLPDGVTVTATVTGDYTGELAYVWDYDGDGKTDATVASPTITAPGFYRPFVRVTDGAGKTTGAFTDDWLAVHNEGMQSFYVDYSAADDQNTGFSPEKAFKTLARAVGRDYVLSGDEIVLAKGTHALTENVAVDKVLTIRGAGTKEETVVVSAGSTVRSLKSTVADVTFHTLTLAGSKDGTNSEVYFATEGGGALVSNIVVRSIGDNPVACTQNYLWYSVGGNSVYADIWATNCLLKSALFYVRNAKRLDNFVVVDNVTTDATAGEGRGHLMSILHCKPEVRNCTIVGNDLCTGAAVYVHSNGDGAALYNNIIWNNYVTSGATKLLANVLYGAARLTDRFFTNCSSPVDTWTGSGNFDADPQFQADGLHFQSGSPCNHKADPGHASATDIEGRARGDEPSIGAFEYVASKDLMCAIEVVGDAIAREPQKVTLYCRVDGDATEPVVYTWDIDGDGEPDPEFVGKQIEIAGRGAYQPTVSIVDAAGKTATKTYDGVVGVHSAGATTYYVDYENGNDTNDGLAPGVGAWKTLLGMSGKPLVLSGDEVVLAKGLHPVYSNVRLGVAVRVHGTGMPADTLIAGTGADVFAIEIAAEGAQLDGVTVAGVNTDVYKAVRLKQTAAGLVSNVVITAIGPNPTALNVCSVESAVAGARFSHLTITNCVYTDYIVWSYYSSTFDNCLVAGNRASAAALAAGKMCRPVYSSGVMTCRYCTIVDNVTSLAGGMHYYGNGIVPTFENCIVWNNRDGNTSEIRGIEMTGLQPRSTKISYNCVNVTNGLDGVGNIIDDPLFKDAANGDYTLTIPSPCRDTGLNGAWSEGTTDLRGNPRRFGRRTDRGCFELPYGYGLSVIVR